MLLRGGLVASLAVAATLNVTDRQSFTVPLPTGRAVTLALTVGHLRVEGESRADARIDVVRTAPSAEALSRIPVRVEESAEEVRIVGVQADDAADPALRTDVTLRVPREALLKSLRVMEGRITLAGLGGTVNADLRRGPIEASGLQGTVRLETGIGDVTATNMRLGANGLIRLRAFNGNVRLALAARPSNARVMALALNGTIKSEIALTMKNAWGPRWGETTIGDGDAVISLDVITGVIEIEVQ